MRKIFFLFVLLCVSTTVLHAQAVLGGEAVTIDYTKPKEYEIGGITIKGTQFLDENVLINLSGLIVGDSIDVPGEEISNAIKNLWKQGLFVDAKILVSKVEAGRVFFEIHLTERPRLSKYSFKGVTKSEADKIREQIGLEYDKVITNNLLVTTKTKVRNFFLEKGYLDTDVKINEKKDSAFVNKDILEIVVDKKEKYHIRDIYFEGNSNLTSGQLLAAMKDTKRKTWYKIFTSGKFDEEKFNDDKKKIVDKYNEKGFRDAHIISDSVYKKGDKDLYISLKISEGNKYFFRDIMWLGNTKHSSQELNSILNIKKGDIYNQAVLEERLYMSQSGRDVTSIYMDDGYLFFSVNPVEVGVENDSIDLEMRIYEGKQAIVNKITISGNTKTNDRVILREIRTKPGQLFNRSDIIRTQRELAQLGYFDQEKLGVNPKPNPADGTVDIDYSVEEKPSDQLELSGGYGGGRFYGTLGVTFNNFSASSFLKKDAWAPIPAGDGQRLSLRVQSTGSAYQSINASFTEPYLGGNKPNSLSVSTYYTVSKSEANIPDALKNALKTIGVAVGLGKRLYKPDDYFSLFNQVNFEHYIVQNNASIIPGVTDGEANNLNFSTTLSRNSIDAPIYPRSGSSVSISLQFTPPYSWFNGKDYTTMTNAQKFRFIEYHKWKFNTAWYTKLAGNLVLHAKIQYGFLGYYNPDIGAPPFERFSVGGDGLVGYQPNGLEVIGLRGYTNGALPILAAYNGGTVFEKYTVEMRYPISLNPSATIYMLGFAEGGNAWNRFKDFNPFSAKRSAGFGVRIFLPVFGMLGLDWGYGFDEIPGKPAANESRIQFTLGQQF